MILRLASLRVRACDLLGRDARRLRRVARTPGIATPADIGRVLAAHGVAEPDVRAAVAQLVANGPTAPVAWAYAMAYDGADLTAALVGESDSHQRPHVGGAPGLSEI